MENRKLEELVQAFNEGRYDRRELLRRAIVGGLSASAMAALLVRTSSSALASVVPSAQGDPTQLVICDNMSDGGLWLYLDPAVFYEVNPSALMNMVYEPLYHLPDSSQPDQFEPLLADGMPQVSEDGTEVTIKLRSGVTFHNTGNSMTAEDVVFSLERTRTLKGNPSYLTSYWTSVEAVDESTVKFTLPSPNPALVAILTSTPLAVTDSKAVAENGGTGVSPADVGTPGAGEVDTATEWINENSVGTGPYRVGQWDVNSEVIIEANPDYWGDPPAFERMIWRNIVDNSSQLQAVQVGEADIAFSFDPDALGQVESDEALQLLEGQTISLHYLALHNSEEVGGPLANQQLRQAIAYAIDYQGILDGLLTGAAIRPATVVPIPFAGTEEVLAQAYQQDLARAQELFDASGVGEVDLTFSYRAEGQGPSGLAEETLATKLQSDLQQIQGLTITLNPMDANTWIADYRASKLQFTISPWGPDYPDIRSYTEPFGRSGQGVAARVAYNNPETDALLDQIAAAAGAGEDATNLYVQVQQKLIEDAPFICLYQPTDRKPARAEVQGATIHFLYNLQLRYATKAAQ